MEYSFIIGVVIGGVFTLAGGWLQAHLLNKNNKEERIINLKMSLLEDFMGNRIALADNSIRDVSGHEIPYFSALNRIDVTFSNSEDVIRRFRAFENARSAKHTITSERFNEILYEMVQSMYIDLQIEPPSKEQFFNASY